MQRLIFLIVFIFVNFLPAFSQSDSVGKIKYSPDYKFKEGIYLTVSQLKMNNPVPKTRIVSSVDYSSVDFFPKLVENEKISYFDNYGMRKEVKTTEIWGFCRNGSIYVNWNDDFNRIGVLGSVCHFISNKTETQYLNYDPYGSSNYYNNNYGLRTPTQQTTEMRQYVFDFETEKIYDYTVNVLESILMRDTQLYDEYNNLRNKKKNQLMFLYLRKFNERNPLYLPNN